MVGFAVELWTIADILEYSQSVDFVSGSGTKFERTWSYAAAGATLLSGSRSIP